MSRVKGTPCCSQDYDWEEGWGDDRIRACWIGRGMYMYIWEPLQPMHARGVQVPCSDLVGSSWQFSPRRFRANHSYMYMCYINNCISHARFSICPHQPHQCHISGYKYFRCILHVWSNANHFCLCPKIVTWSSSLGALSTCWLRLCAVKISPHSPDECNLKWILDLRVCNRFPQIDGDCTHHGHALAGLHIHCMFLSTTHCKLYKVSLTHVYRYLKSSHELIVSTKCFKNPTRALVGWFTLKWMW